MTEQSDERRGGAQVGDAPGSDSAGDGGPGGGSTQDGAPGSGSARDGAVSGDNATGDGSAPDDGHGSGSVRNDAPGSRAGRDDGPGSDAGGDGADGSDSASGDSSPGSSSSADMPARELRITVARTGGVAGLRPSWTVTASEPADVDSWLSLVESCPWNGPEPVDADPDRFVYTIRVLQPETERDAQVPERHLGPWRDLIDRVKKASST
ncbi:protealysin inhibitor emfourin [Herbiconiux daphne]|uniref:Uncharacterized protein n=1 Tax=Herbiconiux daphne TaxID=2970914 RepID=A0ABT2H162_9MICO|nr:protealysin inhibitor emfourin [Herbiconiux daphne]MCS5733657.1 hypothetical protein [Herbiconiux daphne]